MVRLVIDDVTLAKADHISVHVRFKGGQTTTLTLPAPQGAPDLRPTPPTVVAEIDRLLDHHTDTAVAAALNDAGVVSGTGQPFNPGMVRHIRLNHQLTSLEERLRARGLIGLNEIAQHLGMHTATVKRYRHEGRLTGIPFNDKGECLYPIPQTPPHKKLGRPPNNDRPTE